MLAMLFTLLGTLSTLALASSTTVQPKSSSGTSTYLSPSTSTENGTTCYTKSHFPLQEAPTTPAKVSPSTSRFAVSGCAGPTSHSKSSLLNNEAEFELEYWQVAPRFLLNHLDTDGYLAVDDDVTETMESRKISARAPSAASSTSTSTSIDLTSLFLGPLIPTSTTSTSTSLTSASSSSKSKSTTTSFASVITVHNTTISEFTTVVGTTVKLTLSASTSISSSSTINPFTVSLPSSTSSQSTTLSPQPLTSSSSTLSIETLPTNLPAAATTISSALFSNGDPSSSSAATSNPTTISPTSNSAPSTTPPTPSSTMAPMSMLPTSSAIGIGAGIGAAGLLILAAWFIIRRRRKRYAAEREKRKSGINMVMDTDPTRYEKPDVIASQPSSASAQDAAELGASGVYEMDAGDSVWAGLGNGHGRMSPRLYRPVQEYGREDERGRSFVG